MDQFRAIWESIDQERMMPLVVVQPLEAKLVLDESMAQFGTKSELTAYLKELQPSIVSIIALAKQPTEQFGEPPEISDENPNAHMQFPRAWIQNFVRLFQADASWQWELGHADEVAVKLATNLRLSRWLLEQEQDPNSPMIGIGILSLQCRKIGILFDDGIGKKLSPRAVADLHEALSNFDEKDPGKLISGWASSAERNVRWFRQELSGPDAGERYAKYLQANGMFRGAVERLGKTNPELAQDLSAFGDSYPEKEAAEDIRGLTSEQLNAAIDRAETLIEPMSKAIVAQDVRAIKELSHSVRADPTQLARCIIGPVMPVLEMSRSTRKSLSEARERVDSLIK